MPGSNLVRTRQGHRLAPDRGVCGTRGQRELEYRSAAHVQGSLTVGGVDGFCDQKLGIAGDAHVVGHAVCRTRGDGDCRAVHATPQLQKHRSVGGCGGKLRHRGQLQGIALTIRLRARQPYDAIPNRDKIRFRGDNFTREQGQRRG